MGPFKSGQIVSDSHHWDKIGNYDISVEAVDIWGAHSDISDAYSITIPRNRAYFNIPLFTLIQQLKDIMIRFHMFF